ncbi:MAG: DUF6062 family protein [Firmicutes bacterium]|nr:DUF6062 family protein [Bacillota bacterium]
MGKDMVWYALYDAMQKEQCPICELVIKGTLQSIESFLYEGVNDRALRSEICSANGFCSHHAYMMMKKGDPLAHALIYGDLLNRAIDFSNSSNNKGQNSSRPSNKCLFCSQANASEKIYIEAFTNAFGDEKFSEKYSKGGLLCMPHLNMIQNFNKKPNISKIKEITLSKYEKLIHHLDEIKRKNDYRFSHEEWSKQEALAWKQVVYVLNSKIGGKFRTS